MDQVGLVLKSDLKISAAICREIFPTAEVFSTTSLVDVPCVTVDKITLAGREKFRSVIVPMGWYRTDEGDYAKVIECVSVGVGSFSKSTAERKKLKLMTGRHQLVNCRIYRLNGDRLNSIYEIIEEVEGCAMAATSLSRPEHIIRHCTHVGCPGSIVNQGTCDHIDEVVYLVNPFFLK